MKRRALFVFILLFWTFACYAQVEKGDSEIGFLGFYSKMADYGGMGSVQLSYGYYVSPRFQIGLGPQLTIQEGSDGTEAKFSASAFFTFNLTVNSTTIPYLSGQWYQIDFSPDYGDFTDYSYINIGLGVRNFFTDYAALNTSLSLGSSLSSNVEGGILMIMSGLSFIF